MTWLDLFTLLPLTLYGVRWALFPPVDGWGWSRSAGIFVYVAASYTFISHFYPNLAHPEFTPWIQATLLWSVARLLATAKFRDPTGIGRFRNGYVPLVSRLRRAVDAVFVLSLPAIYFEQTYAAHAALTGALSIALGWRLFRSDWRKIFKRSRRTSILHFFSQIYLGSILVAHFIAADEKLLQGALVAFVTTAIIRIELHQLARRRGEVFARDVQARIAHFSSGIEKIEAFVSAIDERFFPARVSVVSIKNGFGLLLASAGTDAFTHEEDGLKPRRLGPLLRRVIREKHILYAPVAEELGSELHKEGLKHSAFAIPVVRDDVVVSVISFMAEEGERIAPSTAFALERFAESLATEVLTAIDQCHAELERDQLRAIAKGRAAMEVEALDAWGRLPVLHSKEERIAVVLRPIRSTSALQALAESPQLSEVYETWQMETYSLWLRICNVFEFLPAPSDANDYIAFAPKEFSSPLLMHLGVEQCALIMGYLLRSHMQNLASDAGFTILSLPPPRIAIARCSVRFHTQNQLGTRQLTLHSSDIFRIQSFLNASSPGQILIHANDEGLSHVAYEDELFQTAPSIRHSTAIRVLTSVKADRKDIRRLDLAILDSSKAAVRKGNVA